MSWNRKLAPAALLVGLAGAAVLAADRPADKGDVSPWVERRVRDWQPTAAERVFDQVGWARDVRDALRLAREHDRPVFLFTHDGHMAVGRC